jgi:hypothetical protein
MLSPNTCIIVNIKMIKLRKLFILFSLFFSVLTSCGVRKPYPYDRFGGGISLGKTIRYEVDKVAENPQDNEIKNQNEPILNGEPHEVAEVFPDSKFAGMNLHILQQNSLMGGDKEALQVFRKISTGINITKLKKSISEQSKEEGDKSKKWARILANSALILLLLGLVSLLLFSSESDVTGIALLVLFWLLALVLLLTALVLSIIGSSKRKKRMAG